ncbi:helix-turn-helix transcriptional regulator [Pseudomonas sp. PDM16]|uniref:helix-turn-helix transcriptional regulator n=1 Tax=Pseudomonas sp. PDM16 TaxID=2769292 RepID=UPI001CE1B26C|nr:helix-turn-helix transcriptional regulator [Pseudomonas sp. PDM16]
MHPALGDLMGAVADETRFSDALSRYATSFRADLLGGAFLASGLEQLAQWGAEFAMHPDVDYWLRSPSSEGTPALLAMGVTPEAAQRYASHYRLHDPLWDAAMAERERLAVRGTPGVWVATDAPVQHTRGFRHSEIYNDFLRTYGIGTRMFGGGQGAKHPVGNLFMSIYRQGDDQGFSHDEVRRFQTEFVAVQHAAFLHREMVALRSRARGLETLMERLPLGVLFFDSGGRLLHANARARVLCERPEGGVLRALQRGSVLASTAPAVLRALFQQSLQGRSGCVELPGGVLLVTLAIAELAELGLDHGAPGVAWVAMERSLDSAAAVALARQAYRLSPAESELLLALMRGQTPQGFAAARGVRISTVRTQMSTLLDKTQTQRQQELLALVARLMLLAPAQAAALS